MCDNDIIDTIPLDDQTCDIANKIIAEQSQDNLKELTNLFNIAQAKKNILRVMKLNSLLDKVSDQMLTRFEYRPGEFSNKDLIDYMNVAQNAIDRANKQLDVVNNPTITLNQQTNNVVINNNNSQTLEISRDSKENIIDAVTAMLNRLKESPYEELLEVIENCDN